jgi:HAD superfamily hydrolase (TIGR01458 family)
MSAHAIDGLLLDIDGVLLVSWEPIPGSIEAFEEIRRVGLPVCLITNTTTHPRTELAEILRGAGFSVEARQIVTAVTATAEHLRTSHAGASVFVLSDGDARDDMEGVSLVASPEEADVIVLGGASDAFTYPTVTSVFRRLMDGAALVAMHRNFYWRTARGLELDAGAYVAGLEVASGVQAEVCGKPSAAYFHAALGVLGVPAERAAMVGDDVLNDVEGARAAGLIGVLVRTGKYRPGDETVGAPDAVIDRLGDLPAWLGLPG